ncbi:MAG: multicopper oxidase family protein [Cypionkella sp.]|nr:multicopper oxidase family protein [Cypionkella sp.]
MAGAAALGCVGVLGGRLEAYAPTTDNLLRIQPATFPVVGPVSDGLVSTLPDGPPPVLRARQGQLFRATVENTLDDYTAMHWHGIRVPNAMDGVPYLTQFPMGRGDRFDYVFTPQDAGTYWYHPHCMTMDQMARGLTGVLVVDEADPPGFDADIALNLRDFRLDPEGGWLDLWTARGAARGGTLGTVMTCNWLQDAQYEAAAGSLVRLRVAATDAARIYRLYLPGVAGRVIALDGHPLREAVAFPDSEEAALVLSPGQRVDLALRMPGGEGQAIEVMTGAPGGARRLARLVAKGADLARDLAELAPLAPNPVADPDLGAPRVEEFVFGWSPSGDLPNNGLCGTLGYTFWSINRTPWPGDAAPGVGPLATLRLGESVVLRLRNESPNNHPIHLHGLVFRPIASNQRSLPSNWTDTVMLQKQEIIDIAFVADNPGDWAFHCHVIEHQKTGLAGFLRVV